MDETNEQRLDHANPEDSLGRDSSKELADREFDELNEGLIAWQIMEWFERTNPQPDLNSDYLPEPGSDLDNEWNEWSLKLCYYADGWKDALKALQERQILEKCLEEEPKWYNFFEYIWARPEEYLSRSDWMTDGEERRNQWIIDLMLFKVDEEEWNNGSTTR